MSCKEYKYDPYVRAWNCIADHGEICSGGFDPKNDPDDRKKLLIAIVTAVLFVTAFVCFSGCTRKVYIPVERTTTVTETVRDTLVEVKLKAVHDTVTIESLGRDTTSYLKDGTHFSYATWKDGKLGHSLGTLPDASAKGLVKVIHTHTVDSIPYPVPVEVEKKLTFWEQLKMEYGGFAMGIAVALGFIIGVMIFSERRRRD